MAKLLSESEGTTDIQMSGNPPTCVAEVMTRNVVALSPEQSFQEAITLIARHRFRHLLVTDAKGHLAGVISDRDLLRFMIREPHWESATVADVMKSDLVTATPATSLSAAIGEMLSRRINCLPVVEADGRLVGILTSTDLLRAFQQIQEQIEQRDAVDL
ncbi:MAG TPA: CBS domain-containing protein [Methylomirabilota bacterium]|jgi:CBS domain-containing protein|nr:CBS domain-containing protein [Methylomirabilota bacterium]